jgi:FAD/FMN-containing dehydrogenase
MDTSYVQKKKSLVSALKNPLMRVGLNKKTSNIFRDRKVPKKESVSLRDFNSVIAINAKEKWADVEGLCTYESFVDATLPHNLVPTVAPELVSITVGGAITGIGVESSCFKYGFVHETVLEMDILTGENKIITCSPTKNKDLFFAIPNSYGTLGYIVRARVMLVPCKKYVKIEREKYTNYEVYVSRLKDMGVKARADDSYDYIDGLVVSPTELYANFSKFVDDAPFVSDYRDEVYYKSFHKEVDYVTTRDYIFRYDFDWFWSSKTFGLENPLIRKLWGRKNMRSDKYYKLFQFENKYGIVKKIRYALYGLKSESLIQDAEVPWKKAADFLDFFHKKITMQAPLTVGPVISYSKTAKWTLFPMDPNEVYMNIGYYYGVGTKRKEPYYYNRLFDKKILSLGCLKMMYSHSTFTKKEFWGMYDEKSYAKLKKKYDPGNKYKDLYKKCVLKK